MSRTVDMVETFHRAFGLQVAEEPRVPSRGPEELAAVRDVSRAMAELDEELLALAERHDSRLLLRLHLCQEELSELAEAMADEDIIECLDALCDMRVVADGTTLELGLQEVFDDGMDEVQSSNMSKLGEDGRPVLGPSGRLMKGPRYFRPDLRAVLERGHE